MNDGLFAQIITPSSIKRIFSVMRVFDLTFFLAANGTWVLYACQHSPVILQTVFIIDENANVRAHPS